MEKNKEIELRSEEFQEILGAESPWILRWGNLVVLTTICVFLFVTKQISYSNSINAPVTLTSNYGGETISFPKSGYLVKISVNDSQTINKGDLLFVITTEKKIKIPVHAASQGIIRFSQDWRVKEPATQNQIFGYITNPVTDKVKGNIVLHSIRSVKVGQNVYVTFPNLPEKIQGKVSFVARVPFVNIRSNTSYLVTVSFPCGLITTKGEKLPYYPGMKGEATILTDEESLFNRFLKVILKPKY